MKHCSVELHNRYGFCVQTTYNAAIIKGVRVKSSAFRLPGLLRVWVGREGWMLYCRLVRNTSGGRYSHWGQKVKHSLWWGQSTPCCLCTPLLHCSGLWYLELTVMLLLRGRPSIGLTELIFVSSAFWQGSTAGLSSWSFRWWIALILNYYVNV